MTATMEKVAIGLNAVIAAVTEEVPRVLTVRRMAGAPDDAAEDALPFGPLEPETDRTLDRGLRRWVFELTALDLGYVEQLYTFGDRDREWPEGAGGTRVVSVAYLALVREGEAAVAGDAHWRDVYGFLPWEDWRGGRPQVIDEAIAPALARWVAVAGAAMERRERADIAFGLGGAAWDGERVLERYELLYEAGLVPEARRDAMARGEAATRAGKGRRWPPAPLPGRPMALDHRRILATALGRLRGKLKYRPVIFELLAPTFTLLQLQRVVEALAGVRLHKQNFRRLVENGGLVVGTGRQHPPTGGRPAELFVFRREVLRERPAPGVGLPGVRRGTLGPTSP
ncbi:MAG TPA: hypothetical protein VMW75_13985 [Thermoanaerobaculia bacterium]|nr:hypothetical protein [Thermoanaerobaculia bacterium]